MVKLLTIILFISLLMSCAANKNVKVVNEMPACLQAIIKTMTEDPNGAPQSVTRYTYNRQTVYYMVSPCCDKYNVAYDTACNILGYPDGGITGRGDGRMVDFKTEASDQKLIWTKK